MHSGADHAAATHEFLEAASTKYTLRDSDHRRDAKLPSEETASLEIEGPLARAERYQFRPGAFLFETGKTADVTPVADQRQVTRTNPVQARLLVQRRLQAQRSSARRWSFASDAFDLQPSTVLRVEGDPLLEGRKLLVLMTAITGARLDAWHVTATVVPAEPWRPALETPRPTALGLEPATVVGPAGEEIHVDEFGRVKVQFHWDREGKHDDESSCWVPVSSGWAGTGYGAIMIPRIGHEVLVEFLGGDPDRPIVTGRVFSHLHPTPYKLPDDKSVTVVAKTSSLGGSGGYNEIKADDRAGAELLYVQAERDMETLVKREERRTIGASRITDVTDSDTVTVGGTHTRTFTSPKPNAPRTVFTDTNGHTKLEVGTSMVEVKDGSVFLTTGVGASITLQGTDIILKATNIVIDAKGGTIDADADAITVDAKGKIDMHGNPIDLNC
jgi:type VI secretion system secreted protein VgrG